MEKITHPYELLVRFDPLTGGYQGAHLTMMDTVVDDDGSILAQREGKQIPLDRLGEEGVTLDAALDEAHLKALAAAEAAKAEAEEARQQLAYVATDAYHAVTEAEAEARATAEVDREAAAAADRQEAERAASKAAQIV
ncbi:MAG TPA: hypothetical protein VNZ61_08670 [Roseomonas sp.]|nr:hypothetical protein [Roseomonas sp.]